MGLEMFQHRRETWAGTIQTKLTRRPTVHAEVLEDSGEADGKQNGCPGMGIKVGSESNAFSSPGKKDGGLARWNWGLKEQGSLSA